MLAKYNISPQIIPFPFVCIYSNIDLFFFLNRRWSSQLQHSIWWAWTISANDGRIGERGKVGECCQGNDSPFPDRRHASNLVIFCLQNPEALVKPLTWTQQNLITILLYYNVHRLTLGGCIRPYKNKKLINYRKRVISCILIREGAWPEFDSPVTIRDNILIEFFPKKRLWLLVEVLIRPRQQNVGNFYPWLNRALKAVHLYYAVTPPFPIGDRLIQVKLFSIPIYSKSAFIVQR